MSPNFEIEDDVPLPKRRIPAEKSPYPFEELEVGQSFWVDDWDRRVETVKTAARLATARTGKEYAARLDYKNGRKGCRVWRMQ